MDHSYLDQKAQDLHSKLINAEYEYLSHIRPILTAKFLEETRNYIWDDTHSGYESVTFPVANVEKKPAPKQKQLYMSLVLLCHPDKCTSPWAHEVFSLLNNANEQNNIELIEKMYHHYEQYKSFDTFILQHLEDLKKAHELEKARAQEEARARAEAARAEARAEVARAEEARAEAARAEAARAEARAETVRNEQKSEEHKEEPEVQTNIPRHEEPQDDAKASAIKIKQETEVAQLSDSVKEEQVASWKTQVWYIWYYPSPLTHMVKDMFVARDTYHQRVQLKLEELKKWNDIVDKYPQLSSTIPKPIVWRRAK